MYILGPLLNFSANDATTSFAEAVIVSGCCVDAAARTVIMKYETKSS